MAASKKMPDTRNRILTAAATMLGESPTAVLSVRGVAAKANVSTGSVRHFFPTQRQLIDTVIAGLYEVDVPDEPILDTTRTPEDRLMACLQRMLAPLGAGEQARDRWTSMHEAYIARSPTAAQAEQYFSLERLGLSRIERWLTALADEGAVPREHIKQRAQFLATVMTGVFAERALPMAGLQIERENNNLRMAARIVTGG